MHLLNCRIMAVVKKTFAPEDVYWVPGNHDGPEDTAFSHLGTMRESLAWANVLVEEGIVTDKLGRRYAPSASRIGSNNDDENNGDHDSEHSSSTRSLDDYSSTRSLDDSSSTRSLGGDASIGIRWTDSLNQTAFFRETGYYLKPFAALSEGANGSTNGSANGSANGSSTSSQQLFVMCTNTMLGKSNPRQMRAMLDDLEWINSTTDGGLTGGVYVLGHYPQVS
jgi:hypothetical protein